MRLWVKVVLTISLLGTVLWLGGSIVRNAIAFDLFVPGTLQLKPTIPDAVVSQTVRLYTIAAFYTMVGYGVTCLGFVILVVEFRKRLKEFGWLFMVFILFFLTIPAEMYLLTFDIDLVRALQTTYDSFNPNAKLLEIFNTRFSTKSHAGQVSALTTFSYITILGLFVFRPLYRRELQNPSQTDSSQIIAD